MKNKHFLRICKRVIHDNWGVKKSNIHVILNVKIGSDWKAVLSTKDTDGKIYEFGYNAESEALSIQSYQRIEEVEMI